jgi:hypothetical protein
MNESFAFLDAPFIQKNEVLNDFRLKLVQIWKIERRLPTKFILIKMRNILFTHSDICKQRYYKISLRYHSDIQYQTVNSSLFLFFTAPDYNRRPLEEELLKRNRKGPSRFVTFRVRIIHRPVLYMPLSESVFFSF